MDSSDPTIATIDATTGVATGVAIGSTTITATAPNGVSGTSVLTVATAGAIATVTVSGATIPAGFQTQVFGTARDGGGVVVTTSFTWSVDPADVSRLSVDANGVITGLAPGSARVIATAPNGVSGTAIITIEAPALANTAIYGNNLEFGTPPTPTAPTTSSSRGRSLPPATTGTMVGRTGSRTISTPGTSAPRIAATASPTIRPWLLQGFPVIKTSDYTNGGFDRGHMMRSADRTVTNFENATTFYLSNVVPQTADLNQGVWAAQEVFIADLARVSNKELYIMTGPAFTGPVRTIKDEGKIRIPGFHLEDRGRDGSQHRAVQHHQLG